MSAPFAIALTTPHPPPPFGHPLPLTGPALSAAEGLGGGWGRVRWDAGVSLSIANTVKGDHPILASELSLNLAEPNRVL